MSQKNENNARTKPVIKSSLHGRVIALPESRQLDILTVLFERRGATVLRVPLIAIIDAPDQGPVIQWLQQFIKNPPDYFVILTGEGLRRLRSAASRQQQELEFVEALQKTCKICRGPKPGRALKEMGLKPDLLGKAPTTAGIIATLDTLPLAAKRLAVQLYGEDPNLLLMNYLQNKLLCSHSAVAPYVYASDSDTELVKELILQLTAGEVDLIAFTSQPQVHRLFDVAKKFELMGELRTGLDNTKIAAIGPVVADALRGYNYEIDIMPAKSFFMKPLVTAVEHLFTSEV